MPQVKERLLGSDTLGESRLSSEIVGKGLRLRLFLEIECLPRDSQLESLLSRHKRHAIEWGVSTFFACPLGAARWLAHVRRQEDAYDLEAARPTTLD
jgi:hypothetical protein